MRNTSLLHAVSVVSALALLTGCSSGGTSSIVREPAAPSGHAHDLVGRSSCPANGQIEYASDSLHNVINVYAGNFAGQPPCAHMTSFVKGPTGLHVDPATHDLYVANENDS